MDGDIKELIQDRIKSPLALFFLLSFFYHNYELVLYLLSYNTDLDKKIEVIRKYRDLKQILICPLLSAFFMFLVWWFVDLITVFLWNFKDSLNTVFLSAAVQRVAGWKSLVIQVKDLKREKQELEKRLKSMADQKEMFLSRNSNLKNQLYNTYIDMVLGNVETLKLGELEAQLMEKRIESSMRITAFLSESSRFLNTFEEEVRELGFTTSANVGEKGRWVISGEGPIHFANQRRLVALLKWNGFSVESVE